jgi:hypothetical protein
VKRKEKRNGKREEGKRERRKRWEMERKEEVREAKYMFYFFFLSFHNFIYLFFFSKDLKK